MKKILTLLACISLLAGCNPNDTVWFDTKEDAIKYGLEQESSNDLVKATVLSVEEYKDETIVFFESANALGVASITDSKKGFSWYRDIPYSDFEGDIPYSTVSFDLETKRGTEISILAGKVNDTKIQKVKLLGDGNERELLITENSRLFYTIHNASYRSLKIIPMID
ncbi:hypothetical protein ACH0B6_17295 [Solibacillus silvestris]